MDLTQYAELFQAEAGEYMQVLNQCLLTLEKDPDDRDELLEAFRVVHSLKGMAGTMGYNHVTEIAHGLENFMEELKSGGRQPCSDILDILFDAVDLLQLSLENPEHSTPEDAARWNDLSGKMKCYLDGETETTAGANEPENLPDPGINLGEMDREILRQAVDKGLNVQTLRITLRSDTLMKSVRVYMIFKVLEEYGDVIASSPSRAELEEEKFEQSFTVVIALVGEKTDQLQAALLQISDLEEVSIAAWNHEQATPAPSAAESMQAEEPQKQDIRQEDKPVSERVVKDNHPGPPAEEQSQVMKAVDKMVRVETQKLDDLVNLVGEMVVARTRITEIGRGFSEDLDSTIDQLKRSITNLQDTAMGLRMVPIKQVFERFPRMVRDLSRGKGKKVELIISGEETELDRSIINRLSDPLVHLLRNSFDHGIEMPDERIRKGKKPEGIIYLSACHEGNQVVITVEDDGGGIDPVKVGETAVKKNVISRAELDQLSNEDKISLIFFNGFSTSAEVTDVSGRGVGMDAVRNSIEALHGSVDVQSEVGQKTRFTLRLPLTLAIIKTMLVKSMGQLYAIPVEAIHENVYLEPDEIKSIRSNPVVNLRGDVIALYTLSGLLGFGGNDLPEGESSVVIVEAANRKAGLVVDELVGQQEIMIKSLGSYLKGLKGIAGATVLGDGSVTLIIDVAGLLTEGRENYEQNSFSG